MQVAPPTSPPRTAGTRLLLPLAFTLALASLAFLPPLRPAPHVLPSFLGAAAFLAAWNALLLAQARRAHRAFAIDVALKKQHYLQGCVQGSIFAYWGYYWKPVYDFAPFILAQLLFAYAFDILLGWSRRGRAALGFAPFPLVCSVNLFLWFKPEWFWIQFALLAVGLLGKELIRWNRGGRLTHIFNPSSFPLALCSLVLLATGRSGMTWGQEISTTQFYPPHMYLALFLLGMPGQFFFGVTSMTLSAVLASYIFGRLYFAATGIYFFYDSYIPISVFLGMIFLFTDPSTSPRTELGRIIYGCLYGLSTVALYQMLGSAGMPTFYDKLLQVPVLNLMVKLMDSAARSRWLRRLDPAALGPALSPYARHAAYISVWTAVFTLLSATRALGDDHPGQWLPFWRQACQEGRAYACPYLADMELGFCDRGSGWACNEAGLLHIALSRSGEDRRRADPAGAAMPLRRGCQLGSAAACQNLTVLATGSGDLAAALPTLADYPIILRGSKGDIREREPVALYALACREGWSDACAHRR